MEIWQNSKRKVLILVISDGPKKISWPAEYSTPQQKPTNIIFLTKMAKKWHFWAISCIFMFSSDFWAPKTSIGSQNVFLESSRVVQQNLKFLSKIGLFFVTLAPTLYLIGLVKVPLLALIYKGIFTQANEVQSGGKCWEEKSNFWQTFQILWNYSRTLEKSILEFYGRFGDSEITFKVENIKKIRNNTFPTYFQRAEKYHFTRPVRYKTYGILPRNHQFLTKISDFVKLFESSPKIHLGVLWTFWGLKNRY